MVCVCVSVFVCVRVGVSVCKLKSELMFCNSGLLPIMMHYVSIARVVEPHLISHAGTRLIRRLYLIIVSLGLLKNFGE